jgi:hypothetical protein
MMPGGNVLRVLIAFEEEYRIYQDATASTFRLLRPHIEVLVAEMGALEAEVARLEPHLVISRPKNAIDAGDAPAWLKLPTGRDRSAELWLDGEYSEMDDPGLDELLRIVDEAERLVRTKANLKRSC